MNKKELKLRQNINRADLAKLGYIYTLQTHAYILNKSCYKASINVALKQVIITEVKIPLIFISIYDRVIHIFEHPEITGVDLQIAREIYSLQEHNLIEI